jgi:hypothetical protein
MGTRQDDRREGGIKPCKGGACAPAKSRSLAAPACDRPLQPKTELMEDPENGQECTGSHGEALREAERGERLCWARARSLRASSWREPRGSSLR